MFHTVPRCSSIGNFKYTPRFLIKFGVSFDNLPSQVHGVHVLRNVKVNLPYFRLRDGDMFSEGHPDESTRHVY